MVQLHAFEHDDQLRPTVDIDLLGAARKPPAMTEQIASLLVERGAEVAMPPRSNPEVGYRFELDGEIVEILGPDGLKSDPKTLDCLTTFQVSGGTQALRRTEVVLVSLDGSPPVAAALDFGDPIFAALFPVSVLERARQAFQLMSA